MVINKFFKIGGQNRAVWEDVTGSTPLTFVKDCVAFTTTVSARFWLMDCRNVADAARMATDLYTQVNKSNLKEMLINNIMVIFRVRLFRLWPNL